MRVDPQQGLASAICPISFFSSLLYFALEDTQEWVFGGCRSDREPTYRSVAFLTVY